MTGAARLIDLDQKRVAVAVDQNFPNVLNMAGCPAFFPQRRTAAAPEMGRFCFDRQQKGFAVHKSKHENVAAFGILDDGRDQARGVETDGINIKHKKRIKTADIRR